MIMKNASGTITRPRIIFGDASIPFTEPRAARPAAANARSPVPHARSSTRDSGLKAEWIQSINSAFQRRSMPNENARVNRS